MGRLIADPSLAERSFVFDDREDAGRVLAVMLSGYRKAPDAVVLAIPAGGVPVGRVLAEALGLPFELIFVRKLHFPDNPEAGFGAVSEGGEVLLNPELAALLPPETIRRVIAEELGALAERVRRLRKRPPRDLRGKTVILTDDGLASGYTMRAAVREARRRGARRVVVAVPTASRAAVSRLLPEVDELYVANLRSGPAFAVADAYRRWRDLDLDEVEALLSAQEDALDQQQGDPDDDQGVGQVEDRP